jgi:hypothetical protein
MSYAGWSMAKFLGVIMLGLGLNMLFTYTGSAAYMMGVAGKMSTTFGSLWPIVEVFSNIVAYTWPIVATLIGLSYLTCYKKCIASCVFLCYLALFSLAHLWTGDMTGAIWDVLVALFVCVMKGMHGMGMMCEMKK